MALAGINNVSVLETPYLGENYSSVSLTRTSIIRKMWRDLESENRTRETERQQTGGMADVNTGSQCSCSFEGAESENVSVNTSEAENECPRDQNQMEIQSGQEDNGNLCIQRSPAIGVADKERVRQVFREWASKNGSGRATLNVSHNTKCSRAQSPCENECKRLRAVRQWIESNPQQEETGRPVIEEQAPETGCQVEQVCGGLGVDHTRVGVRRPVRGRQAFLDLLARFETERAKEMQVLLESQLVSNFSHRNRIQALFRGRFLRNQSFVQDEKPTSTATTELGLLRQTNTVSDLRKGFLSGSDDDEQTLDGPQSDTSSDNGIKDHQENFQQLLGDIVSGFQTISTRSNAKTRGSSGLFYAPVQESHERVLVNEVGKQPPTQIIENRDLGQDKDSFLEINHGDHQVETSQRTLKLENPMHAPKACGSPREYDIPVEERHERGLENELGHKNSFPGYYSMRNGNEDSNSSSWHLFNSLSNGHYYDGFTPRTITDAHSGHDKDELKYKMLQHEAIFKNQVNELHRLYRRQTDMMEEVKRKEFHKYHIYIDTSSSSSLMPSQKPYDDANRWQNPSFPMGNSTSRPFIFGADISNSPLSCSKGNGSKDCEVVECRPLKVRKKIFDLELPAHEYIETEEGEQTVDNQGSEISSYNHRENDIVPKNGRKTFLDESHKKDGSKNGQHFMQSNGLADLNEPVYIQEATTPTSVDFLGSSAKLAEFNHSLFEGKVNGRDKFSSCPREPGSGRSNMNYTSQCFESSRLQRSDILRHLHGNKVQHGGIYTEISSTFQDHSHFNQAPSLFSTASAYPFISSSNLGNSWSSSGQSWEKSNDSFSRKLTSFQTHPSCLSSPKSHEVFREKWQRNGNGFYNGSSSGSKELLAHLPSVGFDYRNRGKLNDGSQKIFKGSNFVDLTDTAKVMDLNTVQTLSDDDEKSRKCDQTVPSWLLAKPVICNDFKNGDHLDDMPKEKVDSFFVTKKKLSGLPIIGDFCIPKNDDLVSTSASIEHRGFDINVAWDEVPVSEHIDKQIDVKTDSETKSLKNHFDLNSCVTEDDDLLVAESFKSSKMRTIEIDLEAPAVSDTEDEDDHKETEPKPDHPESDELAKIAAEAIVSISGQKVQAELLFNAANEDDPLLWFVEVIDSCEKNMISPPREMDEYEMLTLQLEETKEEDYMPTPMVPDIQEPDEVSHAVTSRPRRGQARRGRPRRDFQRDILPGMASLSRHEITEDHQIFGGLMRATGHSWIGSTRRNGKKIGTRGRLKVKAVEITAASIAPPSPPSPSPPLLSPSKPSNNVEVVGLDERSLTGWGKTTRRPRRQRCAAGNSVAVQSM